VLQRASKPGERDLKLIQFRLARRAFAKMPGLLLSTLAGNPAANLF
jgi:hypothetical protein